MLTVTEPADDLQLLSEEELRVAAGLDADDDSQDETLAICGLQAAAALAAACGVATAGYDASLAPLRGAAPRTLKAETLIEITRVKPGYQYGTLYLARWPVLEILSITEDVTQLTTDDWELDTYDGSLTRISGNSLLYWARGRVIIEYAAGYDVIPADLKAHASRLVNLYSQATSISDANTKHIEIPGVITIDRWVDQTATDSIVPDDIKDALARDGYSRLVLA